MGPGLWGRFTNAIEPDDFELKHHIYSELAALPVDEFNVKMREVMANTKEGKMIVKEIANQVRQELTEEEYYQAMNEIDSYNQENSDDDSGNQGFNFEELMSDSDEYDSDDDSDDEEGFNFDELF